ncbi:hypothetical protein BDV29DRAFT_164403 [Aspergillus leporis]|uniref:Uncharacterized protein n=1 Tax=Aspergillus leporis TaxID=41062 RepID=A0A5N5XIL4_9EURO|nr:hypothetical protein BDV29DRAFT_164403 [Aspergillus leporis]
MESFMHTSQTSRASKRRCMPKKPEKPKKPKIKKVSGLLAQWPSPENVIFEPLIIKEYLSPQPILPSGVGRTL